MVCSACQNYASDQKNKLLYQQVRFPESKLTQGAIQKSFAYAQTIEKKASGIINDLLAYKLTQAEMESYTESIKTAMDAHAQVNYLRKQRKMQRSS